LQQRSIFQQTASQDDMRDDWCFQCTKESLAKWFSSDWQSILDAARQSATDTKELATKKGVVSLIITTARDIDKRTDELRRELSHAVRTREGLVSADAESLEKPLKNWSLDDDRVTDFYAAWIGKQFPKIIDRAEKLNAIPASAQVPESVQRYLIEASTESRIL
jgi:hypothetical protein